jgi:heat shock protein HslJ
MKRIKIGMLILLVVTSAFSLTGCKTNNPLQGTTWVLVGLNGLAALPDVSVTISFEGEKVGGTDGCNRYGSTYTINKNQISIDQNVVSTLMACPEEIMSQAQQFTRAIIESSNFEIVDTRLNLLNNQKEPLAVFIKQDLTLADTNWIVTGYNNGKQAVVSLVQGTQISVTFGNEGKVSGNAGCNRFNADYALDVMSISIGQAASTKMMCLEPAGVMEQESAFLQALSSAATFSLEGDRLELRTGDGAIAIQLTRAQ